MTFRSILVPLDGTPSGECALPIALSIARRAGARVELVHAHEPLATLDLPRAVPDHKEKEARRRARKYLDDIGAGWHESLPSR